MKTMLAQLSHLLFLFWINHLLVAMATDCQNVCLYTGNGLNDADCYGRGLTSVPSVCEEAIMLHLGGNNIQTLDKTSLQGYTQLTNLYIVKGNLRSIKAGAFYPVTNTIKVVDLHNNSLTMLENGTFVGLVQLLQLDLKNNQISNIEPLAFQGLDNLTTLFLLNNALTSLHPSTFHGMPSLRTLLLHNNNLQVVNLKLFLNLYNLRNIRLSNNNITLLTNRLTNTTKLESFDLSYNKLSTFDCGRIQQLPRSIKFNLSYNSIINLENCKMNLGMFSLSNNPFDCGCESEEVAGVYRENDNISSPICETPDSKRGRYISEVDFKECIHVSSTLRTLITLSTSTQELPKIPVTGTMAPPILPTNETIPDTPAKINSDKKEINVKIYPIIICFVILSILIIFIIFALVVCKKKPDKKSSHISSRPAHLQSGRNSRPGSCGRSHIYAEIPADMSESEVADYNANFPQSICVAVDCNHGQYYTQHSSELPNHLSDSQDSGLADQWRNSFTEWLHNKIAYLRPRSSSEISNCSCAHQSSTNTNQLGSVSTHPSPPTAQATPSSTDTMPQSRHRIPSSTHISSPTTYVASPSAHTMPQSPNFTMPSTHTMPQMPNFTTPSTHTCHNQHMSSTHGAYFKSHGRMFEMVPLMQCPNVMHHTSLGHTVTHPIPPTTPHTTTDAPYRTHSSEHIPCSCPDHNTSITPSTPSAQHPITPTTPSPTSVERNHPSSSFSGKMDWPEHTPAATHQADDLAPKMPQATSNRKNSSSTLSNIPCKKVITRCPSCHKCIPQEYKKQTNPELEPSVSAQRPARLGYVSHSLIK